MMKLLRYVVKGPSASPSGDGARLFVLWLALLALPLLLCASPAPAGTAERVSVSSTGEQGDGQSQASVISADGRYVAFRSYADNLVSGDTNGTGDIFVHDRVTGATERVWEGDGPCLDISADGRFITFDDWIAQQIFVHDRVTGATELASVSSTGESSWGDVPAISGDGRYVAFQSWATNLVPGDTNGIEDVFVHDRLTGPSE
jgi:Tol biopolymer transport system component